MSEDLGDLKNEAPAGSPPASGSGSREAGPEPDAHTCSPQLRAFGGQATGELQRRIDHLLEQAAYWEAQVVPLDHPDPRYLRGRWDGYAAVYREEASMLAADEGEPRAQSERNRVPNCSRCDQHWYEGVETECLERGRCPFWAIRESDGASGPPNESSDGAAGCGPNSP